MNHMQRHGKLNKMTLIYSPPSGIRIGSIGSNESLLYRKGIFHQITESSDFNTGQKWQDWFWKVFKFDIDNWSIKVEVRYITLRMMLDKFYGQGYWSQQHYQIEHFQPLFK